MTDRKDIKGSSRALGYTRVSTREQFLDGISLDQQANYIEEEAKKLGLTVYRIYVDQGISGKEMKNRPQLNIMLSQLREGDCVIIYNMSRLARNTKDTLTIIQALIERKISLVSKDLPFDINKSEGRLTLTLMAAFAEFESRKTSDRVRDAMIYLSKRHELKKKPYFGKRSPGKGLPLVDDEEEMKVVKLIEDMYEKNNNISNSEIARQLTIQQKICRKSKKWHPYYISKIRQYYSILPNSKKGGRLENLPEREKQVRDVYKNDEDDEQDAIEKEIESVKKRSSMDTGNAYGYYRSNDLSDGKKYEAEIISWMNANRKINRGIFWDIDDVKYDNYGLVLSKLRPGDTFVVSKASYMGDSPDRIIKFAKDFNNNYINLHTMDIDSGILLISRGKTLLEMKMETKAPLVNPYAPIATLTNSLSELSINNQTQKSKEIIINSSSSSSVSSVSSSTTQKSAEMFVYGYVCSNSISERKFQEVNIRRWAHEHKLEVKEIFEDELPKTTDIFSRKKIFDSIDAAAGNYFVIDNLDVLSDDSKKRDDIIKVIEDIKSIFQVVPKTALSSKERFRLLLEKKQ